MSARAAPRLRAGAALVGAVVLLGACTQPQLIANVEAFSALTGPPPAATVIVEPAPDVAASLEFAAHAEVLGDFLERRGFAVTEDIEAAAWRASLGFGVDDGRTVTEGFSVPTTGGFYGRRGGFGGFRTEIRSETVFTREVTVALAEQATGTERWRARVISVGRCPAISAVIEPMLAAAFADFPAEGQRTVRVDADVDC